MQRRGLVHRQPLGRPVHLARPDEHHRAPGASWRTASSTLTVVATFAETPWPARARTGSPTAGRRGGRPRPGAAAASARRTASASGRSSTSRLGADLAGPEQVEQVAAGETAAAGDEGRLLTRRGPRARGRAATRPSGRSRRAGPSCASQPSSRRAFSTEGQRRWTSTSKLGRCSSSKSSGSSPQASQITRGDLGHA